MKYYTFSTGDFVLDEFNAGFAREGVGFVGKWLLLAHWIQVPQFGSIDPENVVSLFQCTNALNLCSKTAHSAYILFSLLTAPLSHFFLAQ